VFSLLLLLLGLISSSHSQLLKCFVKQSKYTYLCGDPCGVLVTHVIKKKHSTGLSDRLREGKGWNRTGLCGLLNGD
jgi:AAA+ ATPase superfamily predicted ATPase